MLHINYRYLIVKTLIPNLLHFKLSSSGVAIIMTDVISQIPQFNINNGSLRPHALLQNLPSIVCSLVLNPQPDETILDMCAAPGNKTTHISLLMKGQVNGFKEKEKKRIYYTVRTTMRV